MKVVLVSQIPEVNNKYSFALAEGVRKAGADVCVCGIAGDDVSEYTETRFLGFFDAYSKVSNPVQKLKIYYAGYKKLLNYCVQERIDVVHFQWYIFSPIDYLYLKKFKKRNIKVIVTIHDLLPFNKKFYDFYFHKKIYRKADAVISQAAANKHVLLKEFKVPEEKIHYIPHGHYMKYAELIDSDTARNKLNIQADKRVILFFGQIKKVKGVDVLIKAMRLVKETHPDVLCIIAGKVWKDDFTTYQQLIDDYGLNEFIRSDIKFIADDDIKYYFNSAEVVVLPYRKIYQSGVVLLGAAYEKPIVATKEGEFLQVIKNGETGLLVEPENDAALAEAICWHLDNPNEAKQMAKRCKEDLSVRLSWDTIGKKIYELYK